MNVSHVVRSISWLKSVQNQDGGWGMYEHHPSRIVTTAEAVTAMATAGDMGAALQRGVEYLITSAEDSKWCQYTRHFAWVIYALTRAGQGDKVPPRCLSALQKSNAYGGWSHGPKGEPSIFATFLGWRALNVYERSTRLQTKACQWLGRQARAGRWSFSDGTPSYALTSYAVIALSSQPNWNIAFGPLVNDAVQFLRTGEDVFWPIEQEHNVSGDFIYNFHHFTLAWVLMALIKAGVSVFDPQVVRIIKRLYIRHYNDTTGGWSEVEDHRPSVFGTSHVLAAMETFHSALNIEAYLKLTEERANAMTDTVKEAKDVFVVYGHDTAAKLEVARFLELVGCRPILLEEEVDAGITTIYQKFTDHAERAAYAIVLMTPDDITEDHTGERAKRARQNVILELGFFIGKLGPEHVCLAKKGDVEIPSDINGVLYLNLDDGGWKLALARKLKRAGLSVDLAKLV